VRRYAVYRGSGVKWIGQIPEHWDSGHIRRFAKMKSGHTPSRGREEYWVNCTIPWFTLADVWQLRDGSRKYLGDTASEISQLGLSHSAAELLPAGTVVLSRTASVGFSGIMPAPMATSQDFWNWVCGPRLLPDYLLWTFRAMNEEFRSLVRGSTHQTIYQPIAAAMSMPAPPVTEQAAIADYLDRETARIDEMISQQEDLVAAMALRRDAAVRAAVWAKASWRRVRNKNVLFETQDLSPSGNEELLSVSHITGVGARADMDVNMIEALSTIGYKVVRPDDLVINTLWGWMGALGVSQLHGIVSPAYGTYRAIDPSSVDMRFFGYLYRSSGYVGLIGANSRGVWSSRLRIYPETFLAMPVDIPPLAEQTKIADELDAVTTHLDLLSQECRELIALLKERRAALITAAVTGQIDVRSELDLPDAEPKDRINSAH